MLIVFLNILFVFYSLSLRGVSTAENLTPKDASLSKALSWLLRHGAIDEGLTVSEDGYIKLEEVLQHRLFARRYTPTDIRLVVNLCKNRFTLRTNPVTGIYEIRANSGHTFKDRNNQGNKKSDPKVRGRTYPQTNLKSGKNYNHQQPKNNKYDDLLKNYNIPVGNIADKENNNKRGRKNVYKSLMKYPELKKNLLWILRYGSEKEGLTVKRHGYVAVDELMNHSHFKDKCMREDIITVANNEPHNFKLRESPSTQQLYIRARKEHPIKQEQEDWSVIPDVLYIPLGFVIHGINGSDWDFVSEHGLKVPKTGYLYCSPYYAADSWHTRGVTKYDDIYIHIDCGAAMRDGIEFFLTPEYSVATKGDKDGFIRTQYFKKVIEAKSGANAVSEKHLEHIFSKYGKISKITRLKGKTYVFIQFIEKDAVQKALKGRDFVHGRRLFVTQYKDYSVRPEEEFKRRGERERALSETSSTLSQVEGTELPEGKIGLKEMPVKLADLGLCSADDAILWQAADFVSQVELSPEMYQSLEEVKSDIENLFHPVIPYCQAIVFGSCGSTLAFKNSDVDLFLQKDGEPLKNFVRKEGKLMYRSRHFRNIVYIPSARIPIIKFQHVKTGWQGDLTASSQLGVCNTRLIRFLVSLDHRIKPLVMIIKYWAKVCGITDSGAHREFTTYSLVMLVIFYLQQLDEPLLPTIARLQQMCQHKQYSLGWECSFCDEEWSVQSQCLPPNNMSLRQLLTGFFKFYYNFDLDNVICPLLGRSVHVKDFETEDGSELPEEMVLYKERLKSDPKCKFKTDTTFRVQDPFELCLNITRNVVDKTCSVFKEACKVSLELCEQQADDALLEGLFSIDKDSLDLGDDLSINITCGEMSFDGSQTSDSAFTEWCQMTKQSIMLVLEHIYKLDVNLQKEKVFKKVKKLESSQDVHNLDSTHEDSQIFECCCKVDVWQRRKKKEKSLNRMDFNLNSFEREVCISNTLFHPNDNKPFSFTINLSVLKSAKSKGIKMNVHVKRTQHKLIKGFMNSMRYDFKIFVSQAQDFVVSVKKSSPLDGKDSLKGLLQLKLEKLPDIKDLMMKESIKRNAAKIAMEKEKRSTTQKHCEKSCETVSKPSPNDEQQTVNQVASHENLPTQETQKLINNFFKPTNHEGSCKSLNHSEVGKFNKLLNSIQKNETKSTFTSKNTNAFLASIEKVALNSSEMLSNSETDQTKNLSGEKKSCNLEQQGNSKKIEENIEDQALVVKKVEEKIDALLQMHRALIDNKQDQDNQNPAEKRTVSEINDPVQSGCPKIIEKLPSASVETVEAKNESDHKINQSIDPKTVIERPKIYSERPKKQWKPNKTCGNQKAPQEPRLWVGGGPPNCLPYHSQSQPQAAATNKPSSSTKSHCSIQNQKKWYPSLHKDIN